MSKSSEEHATVAPDTRFARRATPPTERAIWLELLWDWRWGFALLAFILIVVSALGTWRMWEVRDASYTPLQRATATVLAKSVKDWRGRAGNGWDIKLRLNGQITIANTSNLMLFSRLNIGDTVTVAYSVGRSGHIYVAELAEQPQQHAIRTDPASR